ncbi:MAG TPA: RES family NAD+ phosphorylase [Actinomycetes bacterium]|jgi:hypothetical protein|nr:RES family NAD+ phosphorylase [Actinomycetes bacterium]
MEPEDLVTIQPVLWRIHRTLGNHVLPWDGFRTFGPLASARFDPHPLPAGDHPGCGVLYAAQDLATSLAEVFQTTRLVNTKTNDPHLTSWTPTRPLRVLDLTGTWAIRNQASASLSAAPRPTCRAWAHAIHAHWPDLDGLYAPSTMTGTPTIALWEPAKSCMPKLPDFSRPLSHAMLWTLVQRAATKIGYGIL